MGEAANPLGIQELLEQCIEPLWDSPSDLKPCALVSRRWTSAAQVHISREVSITNWLLLHAWFRLQKILRTSPHLIRHIHRLRLHSRSQVLFLENASEICNFPFTHLHYVSIDHPTAMPLSVALAIQQLFSLPTLRSMRLTASFAGHSTFLQLWACPLPTVKHLELYCFPNSPDHEPLGLPAPNASC
ncbi:hypothetical protein FB451DRAFT_1228006 [Mycena latifolia]|nr:hypothetical protein FB451DRAFT_1228006 [Mycena latifolia]